MTSSRHKQTQENFNSTQISQFSGLVVSFDVQLVSDLFRKQLGQLPERNRRGRLWPPGRIPRMRRHHDSQQDFRRTDGVPGGRIGTRIRTSNYHCSLCSVCSLCSNSGGVLQSVVCPHYHTRIFFSSIFDFIPGLLSFLPSW